jgi:antitoxin VapB
MALRIENPRTEQLAEEIAEMTGESKAEAIQKALEERRQRLFIVRPPEDRVERLRRFLEQDVWPNLPPSVRGKTLSKKEREEILGYGPEGVAAVAYQQFGKGRHPAALNFGDCMAYAVARIAKRPLLCIGGDFSKTDLPIA